MSDLPRKIRYHYNRPGRSITVYDEWLLIDRPDAKVLLLEAHQGKPFVVDGRTVLERGAPILWFVFPGSWYDVGRFHLGDGTFTGWYTNITTPPDVTAPADWSCTDLFLDLWTPPNGPSVWLDEAELSDAVASGVLDAARARNVDEARGAIERANQTTRWPPAIAREVDLVAARAILTGRSKA